MNFFDQFRFNIISLSYFFDTFVSIIAMEYILSIGINKYFDNLLESNSKEHYLNKCLISKHNN
jgi:hypothetical protein